MRDAIKFQIEGLRLAGEPVPEPRSVASYCEVAAKTKDVLGGVQRVGTITLALPARTYLDMP
jgi:hypothetical protein